MRLVAESRQHHDSEWAAITSVGPKLGVGTGGDGAQWVRRVEIDAGARPGVSNQELAGLRKLRVEVWELRRASTPNYSVGPSFRLVANTATAVMGAGVRGGGSGRRVPGAVGVGAIVTTP